MAAVTLFASSPSGPELRVAATDGVDVSSAGVMVEASDAEGLDSLEITCPVADTRYHTQLSGGVINRRFSRRFSLAELFPSLSKPADQVRLNISVRNTRGVSASASVIVRLKSTQK